VLENLLGEGPRLFDPGGLVLGTSDTQANDHIVFADVERTVNLIPHPKRFVAEAWDKLWPRTFFFLARPALSIQSET
jgi:hypothetical protein